jgi:hypothetical protein
MSSCMKSNCGDAPKRMPKHTACPPVYRQPEIPFEPYQQRIYPDRMNDGCDSFPVAMAYVPWQQFQETYELHHALNVGTIFPELNKPFCGKRGKK